MFESILTKVASVVAIPFMVVMSFFAPAVNIEQPTPQPVEQPQGQFGATKPAGLFPYYLAGGGISSTATSFTLTKFTLPQNDYPIQDSDLSDTFYATLEPGNTDRQEFISCTTVGSNTGGNVTISGCTRGLSPISPYTASTSLQFSHPGGSVMILSDSPSFFSQYGALANDEAITGAWKATTPTAAAGIATKSYVDGIVSGGSVSLDSISLAATAGETFATGTIVYFDNTQNEWMKASAATLASSTNVQLGIAQGAGTDGASINGGVLTRGYDETQSGMTAGNTIYLSDTAGATSTSAGTYSVILGQARTATQLYFDPIYGNLMYNSSDNTLSGNNTFSGSTTTFSGATTTFSGDYVKIATTTTFSYGKNQRVYTASSTFSVPTGVDQVYVEVIGGGGNGVAAAGGAGGGGGAYCAGYIDVTASSSIAIVVGLATEDSKFGGFVTAAKGANGSGTTKGAGGNCNLANGATNFLEVEDFDGGNGDNSNTNEEHNGKGGGNVYGEGGQAGDNIQDSGGTTRHSAGQNGTGYGAGGGGGYSTAGSGTQGLIIVRW